MKVRCQRCGMQQEPKTKLSGVVCRRCGTTIMTPHQYHSLTAEEGIWTMANEELSVDAVSGLELIEKGIQNES
ncbi:MAG: hypothetical protein GY941_22035 [Planctomycetes bacterium]|nr:hypothetical protein [Planctomycetota bacterium]